ncbi:IS66 family transposase [Microbulbifer sp. SSSA002]|uniref:IS66 family transposase n=1 Tax=Microbulbifer sp. SSSA002 TaxID=3243376 RepID=UPI00403A520D
MTLEKVDINIAITDAENLLKEDQQVTPSIRAVISILLVVIRLLMAKNGMNSKNSSIPPSQDQNRKREKKTVGKRKAGGQSGRKGITLMPIDNPDDIETLKLNRRTLPRGNWKDVGYERRQVINLQIQRHVTEYRAQILENEHGQRYVAEFPAGVTRPAQYGSSVKAHAVYLSMFQLLPYERIQSMFAEQYGIPLSAGSLVNFNRATCEHLAPFENLARKWLKTESVVHADETSLNMDGKRHWLHVLSAQKCTLFGLSPKRGTEAMNAIGVLPEFNGTLVHDHWKPYYTFACTHALCNAHHLRELTYAHEEDGQRWAGNMRNLLLELRDAVELAGGFLPEEQAKRWRTRYRKILGRGSTECPAPVPDTTSPRRGRLKRSKSRNLLERLRDYEEDVLRFMERAEVPFTNDQGERDLRMTKVQQKISGCFRSEEGARAFCLTRSYLLTCQKNDIAPGEALTQLFNGEWPGFLLEKFKAFEISAE